MRRKSPLKFGWSIRIWIWAFRHLHAGFNQVRPFVVDHVRYRVICNECKAVFEATK